MRYLSVCSGIEAASVAWHPLGWEPVAFCEIEPFPSAVLAHRFPGVPNYGDFTRLTDAAHPIHDAGVDLLVGGTPCQAFSVAGLRRGLADPRGGLTLEFVRLAQALRPKWIVWENVPGVLSQDGGRAFGAFLGALGELGYGWAYRVLDAQYARVDGYPHAVPQRRRRVFVVGCAGGDASRAASVLFEPEGVRWDPPTRRITRQGAAYDAAGGFAVCGTLSDGAHNGGGLNGQDAYTGRILPVVPYDLFQITAPINRQNRDERSPCHTLARDNAAHAAVVQPLAFDARQSDTIIYGERTGLLDTDGHSVGVCVPMAFNIAPGKGDKKNDIHVTVADVAKTLDASGSNPAMHQGGAAVCVTGDMTHALTASGDGATEDGTGRVNPIVACVAPSLTASNDPSRSPQSSEVTQQVAAVHAASMSVRRLTPTECERLQGFPDGWTQIPWRGKPASECPDGPRYRALGNSMACNVMRWIGRRIEMMEAT